MKKNRRKSRVRLPLKLFLVKRTFSLPFMSVCAPREGKMAILSALIVNTLADLKHEFLVALTRSLKSLGKPRRPLLNTDQVHKREK